MKLNKIFCRKNKNEEVIRLPQTDKERIEILEKEVEKLKKFNDKCRCKDVYKRYEKIHNWWLALVGIAIAVVTLCVAIPTLYQALFLEKSFQEIKDTAQTYKYMVLAEKSHSAGDKIRYYTSAIERSGKDAELYYLRANIYYETGETELARKDCNSALELNKGFSDAYLLRGKIHCHSKNYKKALDDLLMYEPSDEENEYIAYLGYTYYKCDMYSEAIKFLDDIDDSDVEDVIHSGSVRESLPYIKAKCYIEIGDASKSMGNAYKVYEEYEDRSSITALGEFLYDILIKKNYSEDAEILRNFVDAVYDENETIIRTGTSKYHKNELVGVLGDLHNHLPKVMKKIAESK